MNEIDPGRVNEAKPIPTEWEVPANGRFLRRDGTCWQRVSECEVIQIVDGKPVGEKKPLLADCLVAVLIEDAPEYKCLLCGKNRGQHKAKTLHCVVGGTPRYPFFSAADTYQADLEKPIKASQFTL